MKAIIKKSEASRKRQSIIYLKSPLTEVADKFAKTHNVFCAPFKSKTWEKVCRLTNKANVTALKELFPDSTIRFSHKAGCSCGCSPGYVMKHAPNQYGRTHWVTVETSEAEVAAFEANLVSLGFAEEFAAERAAHQAELVDGVTI